MASRFEISATDPASRARVGVLVTPHGDVPTPAFAPVATRGTVKAALPRDVSDSGLALLMANAYHLSVRPGADTIRRIGGLHAFAGWHGALITDSGGYQVFSLTDLRRVDAGGVTFRDPVGGAERRFTPESVVANQEALGADLIVPLDVCTPYPAERDRAAADAELTLAWARRSVEARTRPDQMLLAVVQGSTYPDIRRASAAAAAQLDVDGYAIGGVSVGEPKALLRAAVEAATAEMPAERPRHLLGVGHRDDIVEAVAAGVDTFDCVMPTRVARTGRALTRGGHLNLRNALYAADAAPIEADCACMACRNFSRAALRHWLKAGEVTALTLLTLHNLTVVAELLREVRAQIQAGTFGAFRLRWAARAPDSPIPDAGAATPKASVEVARAVPLGKKANAG